MCSWMKCGSRCERLIPPTNRAAGSKKKQGLGGDNRASRGRERRNWTAQASPSTLRRSHQVKGDKKLLRWPYICRGRQRIDDSSQEACMVERTSNWGWVGDKATSSKVLVMAVRPSQPIWTLGEIRQDANHCCLSHSAIITPASNPINSLLYAFWSSGRPGVWQRATIQWFPHFVTSWMAAVPTIP